MHFFVCLSLGNCHCFVWSRYSVVKRHNSVLGLVCGSGMALEAKWSDIWLESCRHTDRSPLSWLSHMSALNVGTLVATEEGAWHNQDNARTGWPWWQCIVTVSDCKYDLDLVSQCGSTYSYLILSLRYTKILLRCWASKQATGFSALNLCAQNCQKPMCILPYFVCILVDSLFVLSWNCQYTERWTAWSLSWMCL